MKKLALIILILIYPLLIFSQIIESFSDGDFSSNPQWYGNISKFEIINPPTTGDGSINASANADAMVLRSKQNEADAILTLSSNQSYGEWRFSVADGQTWAVSGTNDYKIILISDDSTNVNLTDGTHNFNGYFLQFDGGTNDMFVLYKQTGTVSTAILNTGYPATVDGTTAIGRTIKVIRTLSGDWSIFIDEGFDVDPITQRGGSVTDNTHTTSSWFGISTNIANPALSRVLYFDNLYIGDIIEDTIKPFVQSVEVVNANLLNIQFSESVEDTTAEDILNYSINNGIGNPDSAIIDAGLNSLVHLYYSGGFPLGQSNILTIQNVEDLSNNSIIDTNINFTYFIISQNDIVINELMVDPTPSVLLPEFEYVEIYNSTSFDLDLSNWKIEVGSNQKIIPNIIIPANDLYILCSDQAISEFASFGNVVGIAGFSALTNGGATVSILDENNIIISTVSYSDQWYQDPNKTDGGWSLEKIDPLNNCGGITNWKASVNNSGGTPGQANSVLASNIDTIAPFIKDIAIVSSSQIAIIFSEPIDITSFSLTNINIDQGIGMPVSYSQDPNDATIFNLYLMNSLVNENTYNLNIINLKDDCGNILTSQIKEFIFYQAKRFDVVINELMVDPAPSVLLPEYEYIELYNRSAYPINLNNWKIKIGSSIKTFSSVVIEPDNYLILTSDEAYSLFAIYGNVINVIGTSNLNNTDEDVILYDNSNNIIHFVHYYSTWYQDSYKAEGGWSLEQIDPNNTCSGYSNWIASNDNKGGSPGAKNSVYATNPDYTIPELVRAIVLSKDSIKLFFNEVYDSTTVMNLSNYFVDNGIGQPIEIDPIDPEFISITLKFQNEFSNGIIYTVTISDSISDCAGNMIEKNSFCKFAIPDSIEKDDIVINEVLFNPNPTGVDFVEIINRSDKVFDLADLKIATKDLITNEIESIKNINTEGYLIFPKEYYAFSVSSQIIEDEYYTSNPEGLIEVESLPSYSDAEGIVVFIDKWENIIDEFHYTEEMHFDLLNSFEGVSLERINYERPTNDETNWHSAAETVGFATPAYENSQYNTDENIDNTISISPEIFSPDNDGVDDILNIEYLLDDPGYVANITILDARGRTIRKLVRSELLGISGTISWDGLTDANTKPKIGIYIILVEIFDLKGDVKKYKKTCVLATKLD